MSLVPVQEEVISQSKFDLEGIITDHGGDFIGGSSRRIHNNIGTDCLHGHSVPLTAFNYPDPTMRISSTFKCLTPSPLGWGTFLANCEKSILSVAGLAVPLKKL
uniref:Uncharacterized protein n=1 Tax=Odontella aurita TaxID=265563 RepID=A0A7S4IAU2_9STRA|mmetsp:Transcript_22350/g.66258  ORF Transcript_22350/g.66258 Transcript_22350/m.66258 type:complete len:104 (+) Transcript_22350:534-845(+)